MRVYIHNSGALIVKVPPDQMEDIKSFFEMLGLSFVSEKHGAGPAHYACEKNGKTFEIYPETPVKEWPEAAYRTLE